MREGLKEDIEKVFALARKATIDISVMDEQSLIGLISLKKEIIDELEKKPEKKKDA